jgi:hypothetical protein
MAGRLIMIIDGERFRLTIPIAEALEFALGASDLDYTQPHDKLRQIMGLLVIDALEYSEEWRAAAITRACLEEKWPGCFTSETV